MSPNQQEPPTVILKHYLRMLLHRSFMVVYGNLPSVYAYVTLPLRDDISFLNHPPPPLHLSYNLHHKLICIWYDESYLHQSVHLKLELCTTWHLNLDGFKLRGFNHHSDGLPQRLCAVHCSPSFIPKLNYSSAMTSTTKIAVDTVSSVHKRFSASKPADSFIQDTIALWTILQMLSLIEKADLDMRNPANVFSTLTDETKVWEL